MQAKSYGDAPSPLSPMDGAPSPRFPMEGGAPSPPRRGGWVRYAMRRQRRFSPTRHTRGADGAAPSIVLAAIILLIRVGAAQSQPLIIAVDAVGMTVSDMDRSRAFYADVLGFQPLSDV